MRCACRGSLRRPSRPSAAPPFVAPEAPGLPCPVVGFPRALATPLVTSVSLSRNIIVAGWDTVTLRRPCRLSRSELLGEGKRHE